MSPRLARQKMGAECGNEGTGMWKEDGTKKATVSVAYPQQTGLA